MKKFNLSGAPIAAKSDKPGMLCMANDGDKPELLIMDDIGENWWGEGATAVDCRGFLNKHSGQPVIARINSFGGDAYEGMAIHNAILDHGQVEGIVEGICFSAATIVAMACKTLAMKKASDIGIHRAWMIAAGNSNGLKGAIEWLENVDEHQIEMFMEKTGESRNQIVEWMDGTDDGTVWTAAKAFELGFCDEVIQKETGDSTSAKRVSQESRRRIFQQRKQALIRNI